MAIEVPAVAGKIINLGRAGENLATTVVFDVSSWIEEFGENGTFSLFVQQGTNEYYLQTVTGPLNGKVKWNITNNNTVIVGLGKCELSYTKTSGQDDIVVKSMIYDIMVTNALDIGEEGEMPDPIQSWINEANEVLAEVQDTADWVVGPGGTPVEPSSINNAQYYMNQASDFADAANSAKNNAVSAKNDAVSAKNDAVSAKTAAETAENNIKSLTAQVTSITNAGADPLVTLNTSTTPYKFEFTLPKGSQWFTGTGNPTTISGAKTNDYYLNTTNGQIWKCINNNGGSWNSIGNIKGTPGDNAPEITNIAINQSNYHMIITLSDGTSYDAGYCRGTPGQDGTGAGTVTSVGISNATNGGLTVSGGPIINSGTITVGHTNILTSAQDTQAVYPIKIDKNGHIKAYGSAVTIPDVSGKIDTAGTGLSKSGTTLNHSNSVTAQTTQALYPIKIDAQGHISAYGSAVSVPTTTSTSPKMDGNATVGSETTWAKGDHVHPTDTTRQAKITASGILKGDGSGGVTTATGGTDYARMSDIPAVPSNIVNTITTTAGAHTAITSQKGNVSFNVPTTASHVGAIANPSTKQNGNVLTYNGTNWVASEPATGLPDMTNKSGRYLYTDGQDAEWMEIDALPSQSSSTDGWVLTSVYNSSTSASSAEWQVLSGVTGQLSTPAIRNIYAGTTDLTSSDTLPEGTIYLVYEA